MNPNAKIVRQVVLRFTVHGQYRQHVHEVETQYGLGPIAIPVQMPGGFGQLLLTHTPGDVTVQGLPVYQ